jgi:hypothetical protein
MVGCAHSGRRRSFNLGVSNHLAQSIEQWREKAKTLDVECKYLMSFRVPMVWAMHIPLLAIPNPVKMMNPSRSTNLRTRSSAILVLMVGSLAAADSLHPANPPSANPDSGAFKSDISRAAVTTMPAYTVEEPLSAKTHTLFMGADIAINLDKDLYRVNDVWGSNWVVNINGRQREISAKSAPLDLKITPNLKLTEVSATVVGFRKVPAYSFDNDPSVMLTKGLSKSASMSADLLAVAQNAQHREDTMVSNNMSGASAFAGSDDQFSTNAMMLTAQYSYSNLHSTKISPPGVPITGGTTPGGFPLAAGTAPTAVALASAMVPLNAAFALKAANNDISQTANGNEPEGRVATMGLDAMDVEFDIRSSKPLHNPYVVTMTRFRTPGGKPGIVQNLVYAESLHPIDEHLTHVHFLETGFPFSYELVDFQLHIYNRGEEVATNIAADRVELTREEAFQYVRMEYLGAHPKDTLPAMPVMGKLPSDLPAKIATGKYGNSFYVLVSRDGLADEAYSDPSCTKKIDDPYLESVVKSVRFKPALNSGKPVDGVAVLNLQKLAI